MSKEIETQSIILEKNLIMNCLEESIRQKQNAHQTLDEEKKTVLSYAAPDKNSRPLKAQFNYQYVSNAELPSNDEMKKILTNPEDSKEMKKDTIYLFKDDNHDINLLHKSDIRLLNSAESYENVSAKSKVEQHKCLSTPSIREFDSQNFTAKNEFVSHYLKTCRSSLLNTSPAFNCEDNDCSFSGELQEQKKLECERKSISVSTESDSILDSKCIYNTEHINNGEKSVSQDYFILSALGSTPTAQDVNVFSDKTHNSSVCIRIKKILETFKEDTQLNGLTEKSSLIKIPTQVSAKEQNKVHAGEINCKRKNRNSDFIDHQTIINRACLNLPPLPYLTPVNNLYFLPQPVQQEPPLPQFQSMVCSNATKFSRIKPVPALLLNIPRAPILCPESKCQRMIFLSNVSEHLALDHINLPMERILPLQCKNFFLDARSFQSGTSKCQFLYLLCDQIIGLGSSEYKNFLPILVMTNGISLNQICPNRSDQKSSVPDFFLVWVTGIAPKELSISFSLTVWSRKGKVPSCHIVYSGQMYSIRNSQNPLDVWQSGSVMLLSSQEIATLTNNGKEMLNLQLSIH